MDEYVNGQIYYGIKTGYNEAFVIDAETRKLLIKEDPKCREVIKPFLFGDDVRRYKIFKENYIILLPKGWTNLNNKKQGEPFRVLKSKYPAIAKYLLKFEIKLQARQDKGDYWWELRACDYYDHFARPKIVFPILQKKAEWHSTLPAFMWEIRHTFFRQMIYIYWVY